MEEIEEFLTQLNEVNEQREDALQQQLRDNQRAEQRKRLGLGPPLTFRHRSDA